MGSRGEKILTSTPMFCIGSRRFGAELKNSVRPSALATTSRVFLAWLTISWNFPMISSSPSMYQSVFCWGDASFMLISWISTRDSKISEKSRALLRVLFTVDPNASKGEVGVKHLGTPGISITRPYSTSFFSVP